MAADDSFSAAWLAMREPFDVAARASGEAPLAGHWLDHQRRFPALADGLDVLDLGCGTGANLRFLSPRLGVSSQHWTVVDHDAALLGQWPAALATTHDRVSMNAGAALHTPDTPSATTADSLDAGTPAAAFTRLQFDTPAFALAIDRRLADLAGGVTALPVPSGGLVTGSALLDLVSAAWMHRLVSACARAQAACWFALSVDGRLDWLPADPDDASVARAFETHQRRDKGFGPALGPEAPGAAAQALRAAGYQVRGARTDWLIDGSTHPTPGGGDARAMLDALIDGMARAAIEQIPSSAGVVNAWRERRRAMAASTVLRVGHVDLLALPPEPAAVGAGR